MDTNARFTRIATATPEMQERIDVGLFPVNTLLPCPGMSALYSLIVDIELLRSRHCDCLWLTLLWFNVDLRLPLSVGFDTM